MVVFIITNTVTQVSFNSGIFLWGLSHSYSGAPGIFWQKCQVKYCQLEAKMTDEQQNWHPQAESFGIEGYLNAKRYTLQWKKKEELVLLVERAEGVYEDMEVTKEVVYVTISWDALRKTPVVPLCKLSKVEQKNNFI